MYWEKGILVYFVLAALNHIKVAASAPTPGDTISDIEIVGNKFFDSRTGEQFFMKGIAYQPSRSMDELESAIDTHETKYIDPLADPKICLRDIPYLKELNINTIRVYSVDPSKSHDECMEAFADAGIYLLLDLAEPDVSIARDSPTWDINIWRRYKDVVNAMHKYPNVLGFFAGNEVTNDRTNTDASPFVKAAIRDVKQYIKSKKYREIPVGYSSNDDADTREFLAQYFACDDDHADFYGINMYEWCGYSSYGISGYKDRTEEFSDYPIPIFFSEFGCNIERPRPFTEVSALFGSKMSKVWSGGLAYMYFEEENAYGVVKINEHDEIEKLDDFVYLQKEFAKANPKGLNKDVSFQGKPQRKSVACPHGGSSKNWKASIVIPPKPNEEKCNCLQKLLPCLVLPYQDPAKYKEHFDFLCSKVDCSDIKANGEKGEYGKFSDCAPEQKLALQISKLYAQNKSAKECPLAGRNVYFNAEYVENSKSEKCSKFSIDFLDQKSGNSFVNSQKDSVDDHESTTAVPDSKVGSGSITQYKNSGCAILFVTVFIASFLL